MGNIKIQPQHTSHHSLPLTTFAQHQFDLQKEKHIYLQKKEYLIYFTAKLAVREREEKKRTLNTASSSIVQYTQKQNFTAFGAPLLNSIHISINKYLSFWHLRPFPSHFYDLFQNVVCGVCV